MSRFGGVPLSGGGSRFGGVALDAQQPGIIDQIGSSGLGSAVGDVISGTGDIIKNIPNQNPASSGLQLVGQGAKMVSAPISQGAAAITPDIVKRGLATGAQSTADAIDSTDAGQWIGDKLLQAKDALQSHPEIAGDLNAAANIATILPASKVAQPLVDTAQQATNAAGGLVSKAGTAIADSADSRMAANKSAFVQNLITPKLTPSVKADQFSRSTEQGLFNKRVVEPTQQEQAIASTVSDLPVSANKSLLANYNIISDANEAKARTLQNTLENANVPVKLGELNYTLDSAMDALKQNPWVSGDGEKAAQRVMDGFKDIVIKNNDLSAAGLLQARKDFDRWIQNQKGDGVFDPSRDTPITKAIQTVRQSVNNLIADKVPNVAVKKSLAEQSNLYRAMDNIETKGGNEAPNLLSRAVQSASTVLPGKTLIAKGLIGAAGAGAAAYAPAIAGGLGTAYAAGKLATSPTVQKGVGAAINSTGQLMQGHWSDIMKMPVSQAKTALAKTKRVP